MAITTDQRQIDSTPDPEGLDLVREDAKALIDIEFRLARHLYRVWVKTAYAPEGCASIEEFGRRCNLTSRRTRMLLSFGHALVLKPEFEAQVRQGGATVDAIGAVGRVLRRLGADDPEHDWADLARKLSISALVDATRRRVAEIEQQTKTLSSRTYYLDDATRDKVDRAQVIASRRMKKTQTPEETLGHMADHYLDAFDPHRSAEGTGTRRVPEGGSSETSRYVPREVVRHLRDLYGDRCCVPGCTHDVFLQHAHKDPKRDGGDQEIDDQFPFCTMHHTEYDAGILQFVGLTDEGRAIFQTPSGKILHPDRPVSEDPPPT